MIRVPVFHLIVLRRLVAAGLPNSSDAPLVEKGVREGAEQLPRFYHTSEDLRRFVSELASPGPGNCPGLRLVRSVFSVSNRTLQKPPITELTGEAALTYTGSSDEGIVDTILLSRPRSDLASSSSARLRYALFFGEHGRELISAEVGMYLLKAFCGSADVESAVRRRAQELLTYADLLILPNIDESGRNYAEQGRFCQRNNFQGVDLNRNWGYRWTRKKRSGARPFSAPETHIARKQLVAFKPNAFLSVHSGDRALWTPGAYDFNDTAARQQKGAAWNTMLDIASHVNDYTRCDCRIGAPGKVANVRHPGTSLDYAGLKMNVPYAMAWEIWLNRTEGCLPHFSPIKAEAYAQVLERWSLAMVYYGESAAAALTGLAPSPVLAPARKFDGIPAIEQRSDGSLRLLHRHGVELHEDATERGAARNAARQIVPDVVQSAGARGVATHTAVRMDAVAQEVASTAKHADFLGHIRTSVQIDCKFALVSALVLLCVMFMCVVGVALFRDPGGLSHKL